MLSQFKKHKSMFIYYSTYLKHERNVLSFGFFYSKTIQSKIWWGTSVVACIIKDYNFYNITNITFGCQVREILLVTLGSEG